MKCFKIIITLITLFIVHVNAQDSNATFSRTMEVFEIDSIPDSTSSFFKKALFHTPALLIDSPDFQIAISPLWDIQLGRADDSRVYRNTRGAMIQGSFFDKVTFASAVFENQIILPTYLKTFAGENYVIPGGGRTKPFKNGGFDYYYASSYLNYKPSKYFNMEIGHGKHFIGEGYRSLLLSDNAFNYPYLKLETAFWKIKYSNIYAELMDIKTSGNADQLFNKKFFATHFLEYKVAKWLDVGVFETVVWRADSTLGRGFDFQYVNPIIFFRPVEFSVGSPDNVIMGLNLKSNFYKGMTVYGQVVLDEFHLGEIKAKTGWWANKYGAQVGFKWHNIFNVKDLYGLVEYNIVRPFTYTHSDYVNNYGHYNQPLAHPMGANFKELIIKGGYKFKNFYADVKLNLGSYGSDSLNAVKTNGGDLFVSYNDRANEYGNYIGQGILNEVSFIETKAGYVINPSTKMRIELSYLKRNHTALGVNTITNWYSIGFKTLIGKRYYDFL